MASDNDRKRAPKPYIGMRYDCCNVYQRVYLNKAGDAFVGWCPKCARKVEVKVSPDGSKDRFFTAT